jgi:hypothetical protein
VKVQQFAGAVLIFGQPRYFCFCSGVRQLCSLLVFLPLREGVYLPGIEHELWVRAAPNEANSMSSVL